MYVTPDAGIAAGCAPQRNERACRDLGTSSCRGMRPLSRGTVLELMYMGRDWKNDTVL